MPLGESIRKTVPWIEPILDYFDWRKRVIALVVGAGVFAWSWVSKLPWPVIAVLAAATVVITAYALVFPAVVKIANVGYRPRPDPQIWKYKKQFQAIQAACLIADTNPTYNEAEMTSAAHAWLCQLVDALQDDEISRVSSSEDDASRILTRLDGTKYYKAHTFTMIPKSELIKFCEARSRHPEFLSG